MCLVGFEKRSMGQGIEIKYGLILEIDREDTVKTVGVLVRKRLEVV